MLRFGYTAFHLWDILKQMDRDDRCPDGPHCGCDFHRTGETILRAGTPREHDE